MGNIYINLDDEKDFNELLREEPIYYTQYKIIKRLTNLPSNRILSFSANEANSFIDVLDRRHYANCYSYLHNKRKVTHKFGRLPRERFIEEMNKLRNYKAPATTVGATYALSASVTSQVFAYQITKERRSK